MHVWTPHPIESGDLLSVSQLAKTSEAARQRLAVSGIYPFAGLLMPDAKLAPNFLCLGQIGSGKTLELLMLMRHVLGVMEWDGAVRTRTRLVAYDTKGEDLWPSLCQWLPPDLLIDLHPLSDGGVMLHLGKSCLTVEDGDELGVAIIPESQKSHDFFTPAAQQLVKGVVHTFLTRGTDWTLTDVVVACTDEHLLRHVLSHHPRGDSLVREYLPKVRDNVTNANIMQTLAVKLDPWRLPSLLERRARHYVTIDGWLNSGAALALRGSSRSPRVIDTWNAFVFRLIVSRLRDRSENYPIDETFLCVDEMPESILGDYRDALLMGRIKGVRTAATIQDPGGLIARFGGRDQASEVLGQIGNLCVGRLASPDAADWMSRFFGKFEFWQEHWTYTCSKGETSSSLRWDLREESNIYPYEFQNFPAASLEGGYEVVARTPSTPGWRRHVSPNFIRAMLGARPDPDAKRVRRKLEHSDLGYVWTSADYERLKLRPLPSNASADGAKRRRPKRRRRRGDGDGDGDGGGEGLWLP